jgi:hypothetical protein
VSADTCGAKSGSLTCDRPPHVDGDHRGYDEARDAVLFWPTAEKKVATISAAIAAVLDELPVGSPERFAAAARLRSVIDRRIPAPRLSRARS